MPRTEVQEAVTQATELGTVHAQQLAEMVEAVPDLKQTELFLILGAYMGKLNEGLVPGASSQEIEQAGREVADAIGKAGDAEEPTAP